MNNPIHKELWPTPGSSKTMHMQLSVDAARWSDDMLDGILTDDAGRKLSGPEARAALLDMKARGLEVVPCATSSDPATGRCRCWQDEAAS